MVDWNKLTDLRNNIALLVNRRDKVILTECLDPAFCLPDGNWRYDADNDYVHKYQQLCSCPIEEVPNVLPSLSINCTGQHCEAGTYEEYAKLILPMAGKSILEIGAGNGALANEVLRFADTNYVICDIPETLMFSGLNLFLHGHEVSIFDDSVGSGVTLIPNYQFHYLPGPFDLVVNTLSMSEMSEYQVKVYAEGVSRLIGTSGRFFEMNYNNSHCRWKKGDRPGINAKSYFAGHFSGSVVTHISEANIWFNHA